jgi:hypothetical protein
LNRFAVTPTRCCLSLSLSGAIYETAQTTRRLDATTQTSRGLKITFLIAIDSFSHNFYWISKLISILKKAFLTLQQIILQNVVKAESMHLSVAN